MLGAAQSTRGIQMTERRATIRWWPAVLIVVAALVFSSVVWLGSEDSAEQIRQNKVMGTAVAVMLSGLLLAIWLLFFSRLVWRRRLAALGSLVLMIGAFALLFRYRGVSGDLVPQFEARFRVSATDLPAEDTMVLPGARDYPQFLGPYRNGTVEGLTLGRDWTASPPRLVWRRPVGGGWSGFAVAGNTAVTHEQHSEEERVVSYDLGTGKVNWASREVAHYVNPLAGEGPRGTPTVEGGRVFALGGTGILTALALETGELLWKKDVLLDNEARVPTWGKSASPLVFDGKVVVSAGGPSGRSLVAYDARTGDTLWHGATTPQPMGLRFWQIWPGSARSFPSTTTASPGTIRKTVGCCGARSGRRSSPASLNPCPFPAIGSSSRRATASVASCSRSPPIRRAIAPSSSGRRRA